MKDRDIQEELEDGISAELEQERDPSTDEPETELEGNIPLETREESIEAPGIEEDRVRTRPDTEGIPRQVKGVSSYDDKADFVRDAVTDEFGFNPDISDFDTHGTVEIAGKQDGIEMTYWFGEAGYRTDEDEIQMPALGYVRESLLEEVISTAFIDFEVEEDPSEEIYVSLFYDEDDIIPGTEEALEAVAQLEDLTGYR